MKALIIVDVQNDFCPVSDEDYKNEMGGALAVPDGNGVVPVINSLLPNFDLVIFTKDWHPEKMDAFASSHKGKVPFDTFINKDGVTDTLWPDHCVENTHGADLHKDINMSLIKGDFYIFKKGTEKDSHPYSGFGAEGLADFLKEKNVTDTVIVGLATDYCVKDTVVDSVKEGFNTTVIWDGCRGISDDLTPTLNEFFDIGVDVIDLDLFNEIN